MLLSFPDYLKFVFSPSQEAEIDSDIAALFTAKVRTPVTVAKSVLTACIVLGILWIATAGFVTVYILNKVSFFYTSLLSLKYCLKV